MAIKRSSYRMPISLSNGLIKGGGYWLSDDLYSNDDKTWSGIVIDPKGVLLGADEETKQDNKGITTWSKRGGGTLPSHKGVQITDSGILIYGGGSAWVPTNFDIDLRSTYNGVFIDSNGIKCLKAVDDDHDPITKVLMNANGITMYGTGMVWGPEGYVEGDYDTYYGIFINSSGIYTYNGTSEPILSIKSTGDVSIGYDGHAQLKYDASDGQLYMLGAAIICTTTGFIYGSESTYTGVFIDYTGLYGYDSGEKKIEIGSDGILKIYGGGAIWFPESFDEYDYTTWNGVMISDYGIQCFNGDPEGHPVFRLEASTGNTTIGKHDGAQFIFNVPGEYLLIKGATLACVAAGFNVDDILTYTGVVISPEGIKVYNGNVVYFDLDNSGNLSIGSSDGAQLIYYSNGALLMKGSTIICSPANFTLGDPETYDGVVIDSNGIYTMVNGIVLFNLSNSGDLTIGESGGNQLMYSNGNLSMAGGTIVCKSGSFSQGSILTYDGIIINSDGISAYNNAVLKARIGNDGEFIFGSTVGHKIYSLSNKIKYSNIQTSGMESSITSPSYGAYISNGGVIGYSGGQETGGIDSFGNITVGRNASTGIHHTGSSGSTTIGMAVKIIDSHSNERQIGDIAYRAYIAINSSGAIQGVILGTATVNNIPMSQIEYYASQYTGLQQQVTLLSQRLTNHIADS